MKPTILGISNVIFGTTGYAVQMRHILMGLKKRGYRVANLGWYGLEGGMIEWNGIPIYPGSGGVFGINVMGGDAKHFKADMILSLQDIWALPMDYRERCLGTPWAAYFPVDTTPVAEKNVEIAATADWPIVYSRFGLQQMRDAGLECEYIPHMIDTEVFKPGDKLEARKKLRIPQDAFVCTMVAANKGYPSRKAFPENLRAFKMLLDEHPEAYLRMHTQADPIEGEGILFNDLLMSLEIPQNRVSFCDQLGNANGLPDWYVALTYQASDLLLNASRAEGFCLPMAEAQSCGTPVVSTDCSAMPELTVNGICTEPVQPEWFSMGMFGPGSWHYIPSVQNIYKALEGIYSWDAAKKEKESKRGVQFIKDNFACDLVIEKYWIPFLDKVGSQIENDEVGIRYEERQARVDAANLIKDRMKKIRDYSPKQRISIPKPSETTEKVPT